MKTSAKDPFLNIFGWKKSDFKKRGKEKKVNRRNFEKIGMG